MLENIHWYGHDAFRIEDAGRQIYIDPWQLPAGTPKADLVLVTHEHHDHYSPPDIDAIRKSSTAVVAPADLAAKIGPQATAVKPGQTLDAGGVKVTGVAAYNVGKKFHPKANNWVGYVVTLSDGTTVYHTGDSDAVPEMKTLKVDVALLPVSGTYVMTAAEAVEVANAFLPKTVIPMHYGTIVGSAADAEAFRKGFKGQTVVKKKE